MWRIRYTPNEETLERMSQKFISAGYPAGAGQYVHRKVKPYSAITADGFATAEEAKTAIPARCGQCGERSLAQYTVEEYE
jgi:hypothetical protein